MMMKIMRKAIPEKTDLFFLPYSSPSILLLDIYFSFFFPRLNTCRKKNTNTKTVPCQKVVFEEKWNKIYMEDLCYQFF